MEKLLAIKIDDGERCPGFDEGTLSVPGALEDKEPHVGWTEER